MDEIKKITNLARTVTTDENDLYCRYLNIGMHNCSWPDMCFSRFRDVVEQITGTKKLPYNIKIVDLIECDALVPELFVHLPEQMFKAWVGYPNLGTFDDASLCDTSKLALYYDISVPSSHADGSLTELRHPYDASLKDTFVTEFLSDIPENINLLTHDNGRKFYPYEAYFPYWKSYVLLEALNQCKFIDRYLGENEGKPRFIDAVCRVEKKWAQKYSSTFNRVSWYRTMMAGILKSNVKIQVTYGGLVEYVLQQCNSSVEDLKKDLEVLLTLYQDWDFAFSRQGIVDWRKGMESLKFDIFCVFEMLCYSGEYTEAQLYSEWISERDNLGWANLSDVLPVEEILFKQKFGRYAPLYLKGTPLDCDEQSWSDVYDNLAQYAGFECWIRSFCDMHDALNPKMNSECRIDFTQPRLLDQLLVLTIRTEILLRSFLENRCVADPPEKLIDVLKKLPKYFLPLPQEKFKSIFETVTGKDNWQLTYLKSRPEAIFDKIKSRQVGVGKWSTGQKFLFENILIFNTARNYFAHHSYKDLELKNRMHSLPRDVLVACLYTVIQIESFMDTN